MNTLLNIILDQRTMQAITIYAFLLVIFLIILRYLVFSHEIENKGVSKLIGGLAVFIVALISQNPLVIGTSLFIGGLIIASEEFMQKLAIILRSNSEDIGENLKPVSATPQEVKQKQKQEIQETIEIQNKPSNKKSSKLTFLSRDSLKQLIKYQSDVKHYWTNIFGDKFESDVKIVDPKSGDEIIMDGVLVDEQTRIIEYIFEIRIINNIKDVEKIIDITQSRIRNIFTTVPIVLSLISLEAFTDKDITRIVLMKHDQLSISLFEVKNNQLVLRV